MERNPVSGDLGMVLRSGDRTKVGRLVMVIAPYRLNSGWYEVHLMKNRESMAEAWSYIIPREHLLLLNEVGG